MLKFFVLLAVMTVIFLPAIPAYCEGLRTMAFVVSATLPEHVMTINTLEGTLFSNRYQLVQTETVMRNNKRITLTSIVVP